MRIYPYIPIHSYIGSCIKFHHHFISSLRFLPSDRNHTLRVASAGVLHQRNLSNVPLEKYQKLQPLSAMPHHPVYIIDSNLLIGYIQGDIPGWIDWAKEHINKHKQTFYLLEKSAIEYDEFIKRQESLPENPSENSPSLEWRLIREEADSISHPTDPSNIVLPRGFKLLNLIHPDFKRPQAKLDHIYQDIVKYLRIQGQARTRLRADIELLIEAGYYAGLASREQISNDAYFHDAVVFCTADVTVIQRLLGNPHKKSLMNQILKEHGCGGMIQVRLLTYHQTWMDM